MRINLTSVMVDDQAKALRFYTEILGFEKKAEIPLGEYSWLTVVSPDDPDGTQLVLEPDAHPAARPFKAALVGDGIPFTSFAVDDVQAEYERLVALGVQFTRPPTDAGTVMVAVFDDTCGNLVQITAEKSAGTPLEHLRAQGELDPAVGDLDDLGPPLPSQGDELPSAMLARLRRDER